MHADRQRSRTQRGAELEHSKHDAINPPEGRQDEIATDGIRQHVEFRPHDQPQECRRARRTRARDAKREAGRSSAVTALRAIAVSDLSINSVLTLIRRARGDNQLC